MRWRRAHKIKPTELKVGDTREVIRFLFLPKTLNHETRWLELARIKQVAVEKHSYAPESRVAIDYIGWDDVAWLGCV